MCYAHVNFFCLVLQKLSYCGQRALHNLSPTYLSHGILCPSPAGLLCPVSLAFFYFLSVDSEILIFASFPWFSLYLLGLNLKVTSSERNSVTKNSHSALFFLCLDVFHKCIVIGNFILFIFLFSLTRLYTPSWEGGVLFCPMNMFYPPHIGKTINICTQK